MEKFINGKKILGFLNIFVSSILLYLTFFFFFAQQWVYTNFGKVSISQMLFLAMVPMKGADSDVINQFIKACLIPPLVIVLVIVLLFCIKHKAEFAFKFTDKKTGKTIETTLSSFFRKIILVVSAIACFVSYNIVSEEMGLKDYLETYRVDSTIFDEYYVDPATVTFEFPQEDRNIIYIFLESMETSFYSTQEGGVQTVNYIPELYQLAQENLTFDIEGKNSGLYMPTGATWTVGAMVGQTAGLPLKTPFGANGYGTYETFLPGVTSMGDILEDAGYNQTLLIGSDADFGGRSNYFTQHGNYELFDYYAAIDKGLIPEDYYVWWGYEDHRLFTYAKDELLRLSSQDAPFNLTMLTVDTHFFDGYLCSMCRYEHDNQYANVMSCSSRLVYDFVRWVQSQDFYENTTIVIAGDHVSMDNEYFEGIDPNYTRKMYYTIINSAIDYEGAGRELCTFDMFPTALASMGIKFNSDRLGIGTSAFGNTPTIIETIGFEELNRQMDMNSNYYNNNFLFTSDK